MSARTKIAKSLGVGAYAPVVFTPSATGENIRRAVDDLHLTGLTINGLVEVHADEGVPTGTQKPEQRHSLHPGLLWFDADPDTLLSDKIAQAAQRYYEKFGIRPNIAYVNPRNLSDFAAGRDPLTYKMPCMVKPKATILLNHIWVGVQL